MILILSPEIEQYYTKDAQGFDALMALRGDVFRELEGRRTQRVIIGAQPYFIKQHEGVGWKEIIKNLLQNRLPVTSAQNEWEAISRLQALGIKTLEAVAYGLRGKNPAKQQSFLVTKALSDTISLEDFCKDWKNNPPAPRVKWDLIREVATIANTMHQNGINHRDFYLCHFLVGDQLCLIDLHRAQIRKKVPRRWLVKDLAGLYFSSKDIGLTQRDLYRFIRAYAGKPLRQSLLDAYDLWQSVKQRGDRLYAKQRTEIHER